MEGTPASRLPARLNARGSEWPGGKFFWAACISTRRTRAFETRCSGNFQPVISKRESPESASEQFFRRRRYINSDFVLPRYGEVEDAFVLRTMDGTSHLRRRISQADYSLPARALHLLLYSSLKTRETVVEKRKNGYVFRLP